MAQRPQVVLAVFRRPAGLVRIVSGPGPTDFQQIFFPSTIGPGSVSTLTFTITNTDLNNPATGLAFADNLPAAVTIANLANASSNCIGLRGGTLTAPDGGTTITLTDGAVSANSTCTVTVDVTSSTPGTHMNVSGDLTSSLGNSGTASDDLTVATNRPSFSKSFSPSTISFGGRSTLTFTIDNTTGPILSSLVFTDTLPAGMLIADPANVSTTCDAGPNPTLAAIPGTGVISFSSFGVAIPGFEVLAAGDTCTISVDVTSNCVDTFDNVTSNLSTSAGDSGKASARLTVTGDTLILSKSFTDDPVSPGDTVALEFTIINADRNNFGHRYQFYR
ncbi:MAG: hypothetical protein HC808_03655 [Candidatus Competibacteraceae bacterium]|nr:hypothetical protein [Candidatus Competibacteraceae bacterium]